MKSKENIKKLIAEAEKLFENTFETEGIDYQFEKDFHQAVGRLTWDYDLAINHLEDFINLLK